LERTVIDLLNSGKSDQADKSLQQAESQGIKEFRDSLLFSASLYLKAAEPFVQKIRENLDKIAAQSVPGQPSGIEGGEAIVYDAKTQKERYDQLRERYDILRKNNN
jgi:hypothetical protein